MVLVRSATAAQNALRLLDAAPVADVPDDYRRAMRRIQAVAPAGGGLDARCRNRLRCAVALVALVLLHRR
jgi:hypothetical protein